MKQLASSLALIIASLVAVAAEQNAPKATSACAATGLTAMARTAYVGKSVADVPSRRRFHGHGGDAHQAPRAAAPQLYTSL
jgi:hypothetical protein